MKRRTFVSGVALMATGAPLVLAQPPSGARLLTPAPLSMYRDARRHGGPGKDGIPSIDAPQFWSAADADAFLDPGDLVIGYHHGNVVRAYPQRILVWHEIVNDVVDGRAISVTYCPLTGTAIGFERGDTEFGVSGKLVNSNLVMYDRATGSEYPQMLGTGIAGPRAGKPLDEVRLFWTTWKQWRARHPETEVLSTDTGHIRNYRRDPYGSYNPRTGYYAGKAGRLFPVLNEDDRYPPKREIFGFRDQHEAVAVEPATLAERGVIRHSGRAADYLIIHDPKLGTAWVFRGDLAQRLDPTDIQFGVDGPRFPGRDALEPINGFEAMWFAWAAFYPDTTVIDEGRAS
jgi:hypothetical protein